MHEVEIMIAPERRVIGVPHRGAYSTIGAAFERLAAVVGEHGLWSDMREFLGVYHDDPRTIAEADLRSLAGIVVSEELEVPDEFSELRLRGGRHARLRLIGPYAGLKAAYDWLYSAWLPGSGERDRGTPSFEIYVNSPADTAEADLITDIYLPLA